MVLAKQEINCLLETLQKQQHQFTELADHIQLDAGIPVTFTKVRAHPRPDPGCIAATSSSVHISLMLLWFRTTGSTSVQRWRSGW